MIRTHSSSSLDKPTRLDKPSGYGACPTYLFARVHEARRGGALGYRDVGRAFMLGVTGECPFDIEENVWAEQVERLSALVDAEDGPAILAWFDRYIPRLMALVPSRRRARLLEGMLEAVEQTEGECLEI
jgi:hypothetical protein